MEKTQTTVAKQEPTDSTDLPRQRRKPPSDVPNTVSVIELSTSDSDSEASDNLDGGDKRYRVSDDDVKDEDGDEEGGFFKKSKTDDFGVVLPLGFLDPLPPEDLVPLPEPAPISIPLPLKVGNQSCKQFWKAGDFEGDPATYSASDSAGMDHVRVHPKFLHSNATSHKWVLGAFAELLDNSLDEVCNGATYVNVDMLENKKDRSQMLMIEDNGGGMDPDKMRQCVSLGYSLKSKLANTIGQYGNGFKTSTMRLGADVIVFSRCCGTEGKSPTQSIGLLSYTFLRCTGKDDIVVPMLDYKKDGKAWDKLIRSSEVDWNKNIETIVHWSPYSSEDDLLLQFNSMKDQGTRIIIYNLWEDDQGELELDFYADRHDIQIRGVNRDEKKIEMAKQYPNSRHFLTYQHSLRSYASILYLRLPPSFRIVLRGKDVEHHNIVNDMMLKQEVTYRPQSGADGVPKDMDMVAVVTMGFVKDAKYHVDVQGFNVYHKNRLIKPFWRVWNATGSDGRGIIGLLEANFVEPAHDKQGFERTIVLSRLETKLVQMQKTYWYNNAHRVGYAPRNKKLANVSSAKEASPKALPSSSSPHSRHTSPRNVTPDGTSKTGNARNANVHVSTGYQNGKAASKHRNKTISNLKLCEQLAVAGDESDHEQENEYGAGKAVSARKCSLRNSSHTNQPTSSNDSVMEQNHTSKGDNIRVTTRTQSKVSGGTIDGNGPVQGSSDAYEQQLKGKKQELKDRLSKLEESMLLQLQFERDENKSLEAKLREVERKLVEVNREQETLIDVFSEERIRRDEEEENLRKKYNDAMTTIQELSEMV